MWSDKTMESRSSYEFKGVWVLVVVLLTSQYSFSPGAGECICNLNVTRREQRNSIIMNATSDIISNITAKVTSYLLENTKPTQSSFLVLSLNATQLFNLTNSLLNAVNSVPFNSIGNMVLLLGLQPWYNKLNLSRCSLNNMTVRADKWLGSDWSIPLTWKQDSMNLSAYIQNVFIFKLHEQLDLLALNTCYPIGGFRLPRSLSYSGIELADEKWKTCTCLAKEGFSYTVQFSFGVPNLTTNISEKVLRTDIQLAVDNYASQAFDSSYIQSDVSSTDLKREYQSVTANVKLYFNGSYINLSFFNGSYWTPNNMSYANVTFGKIKQLELTYLNVKSNLTDIPRIIHCTTYSLQQNLMNNWDVLQYYKNGNCPNITVVISNLTESALSPTASPQPTPIEPMSESPLNSASPAFAPSLPTSPMPTFQDMSTLPTIVPRSYSVLQETTRVEVLTITLPKTQLELTSPTAPTAGKLVSNAATGSQTTPPSVIPNKPTTALSSPKTSLLSSVTLPTVAPQASMVMSQSNPNNSSVNMQANNTSSSVNTQSNYTIIANVNTQSNNTNSSVNAQSNIANSGSTSQTNTANSNITSQSDTANNSSTAQTTKTTSFTSSIPSKPDSHILSSSASPNIGQASQTASTSPPGTSPVPVSAKSTTNMEANVSTITVPSHLQGGDQTTALLPNQNTTTSNSTNKTLTTTTSLPTTPFDEDPFFKAVVPVVTKVYNDRVLLRDKMGVVTPLTERTFFYKISIPVATCIIIVFILCVFCLQIDWLAWASKNKDSGTFGVIKA